MLDRLLVEHCAPTLARLKTGSLFNCPYDARGELDTWLETWNRELGPKGVELAVLRASGGCALIYSFRRDQLARDLAKPAVVEFLRGYGYTGPAVDAALDRLRCRVAAGETFPHEIGLFLGYPLGDVEGFIRNQGRNCKCEGCWKVYCDEQEAQRQFARFRKCRRVYLRLFLSGRSVVQLTVAA